MKRLALLLALALAACAPSLPGARPAAGSPRPAATAPPQAHVSLGVDEALYWKLEATIGAPIPITGFYGSETEPERPARARWILDPGDEARASLVPAADGGSATLTFRAPGTVRVRAIDGRGTGQAVFCAPIAPGAAERLEVAGTPVAGAPAIVDSAEAWTRYWRRALAVRAVAGAAAGAGTPYANEAARTRVPDLPAVDFATSSLVVLATEVPPYARDPVLTHVDATGAGLVAFGQPMLEGGASIDEGGTALLVYRVPKLPAGARVRLDCRAGVRAPCASATPFPEVSVEPLAYLDAPPLAVGSPRPLPDQLAGVPIAWRLAPGGGDATLDGAVVTAAAPGAVRLVAEAAGDTAEVVLVAGPEADVRITPASLAASDGDMQVFRTQAAWAAWHQARWAEGLKAAPPQPTAPPPPPPVPAVGFPGRHIVLVRNPGPGFPDLAAVDGGRFRLVAPGVRRHGVFTPARPAQSDALQLDVPAFEGEPRVTFE